MNKLQFQILRILTLFFPLRVELDGKDNSVTINHSLYRLLMRLGIEQRNHIIGFRIGMQDGINTRYGFEICPPDLDPASTITSELLYNTHYRTFGFPLICPTVQQIFYDWQLDPDTIHKTICIPRLTPDRSLYLEIIR